MIEKFILMRHLQDEDNLIVGRNDCGVIEAELPKARAAAQEVSKNNENTFDRIYIFSSSRVRAEITAREVAAELKIKFPVTVEIDPRIREIDQGEYVLPTDYKPGDYFPAMQDAWLAYFKETFDEGNLDYRFGDPLNENGCCKYPQLSGYFKSFGENQKEFSRRFYSFLDDLCQRFNNQNNVLPLVITHQAMAARFAELTKISEKVKSGVITQVQPGSLPLLEWQQFEEIKRDRDIFLEFGETTTFCFTDLYCLSDILKNEIEYFKNEETTL